MSESMCDFDKAVIDFESIVPKRRRINSHENAYFIKTERDLFTLYYEQENDKNLIYWFVIGHRTKTQHVLIEFDIRNVCAYTRIPLRKTVVMAKDRLSVVGRILQRAATEWENLIVMILDAQQTYRNGVFIERTPPLFNTDMSDSDIPF